MAPTNVSGTYTGAFSRGKGSSEVDQLSLKQAHGSSLAEGRLHRVLPEGVRLFPRHRTPPVIPGEQLTPECPVPSLEPILLPP